MSLIYVKKTILPNGSSVERKEEFTQKEISFGRGADCHLRLESKLLSFNHGQFVFKGEHLYVKDLNSLGGIRVNNRLVLESELKSGDLLNIGAIQLTVAKENKHWILLETKEQKKKGYHSWATKGRLGIFDIRSAFPSIFRLSLLLSALGIVVLVVPLVSNWGKSFLVIGPMSSAHSFIEKDCKKCHQDSFGVIRDESCLSCHNVSEHVKNLQGHKDITDNCVNCHLEHSADEGLLPKDDRTCLSCHAKIEQVHPQSKIKNVSSLANHPEFALPERDNSIIKFNHSLHLQKNLKSVDGPVTLECQSCHQVDNKGQNVQPVTYQEKCAKCHALEFDGRFPGKLVPHQDTDRVFEYLLQQYAALALQGQKEKVGTVEIARNRPGEIKSNDLTSQSQKASLMTFSEVENIARSTEKNLITYRGCVLCHNFLKRDRGLEPDNEKSAYQIEKPKIPKVWFEQAIFKHTAHDILSCESCHKNARISKETGEILLPKLSDCTQCHNDQEKTLHNCVTCHSYHQQHPLDTVKKRHINELKSLLP